MKKIIFFLFTIIIISGIIYYKNKEQLEEIKLEILTEKDTYEDGEWISYSVIISNNSKQNIYYKISSCNMEIIGDNGFHAITNIDPTSNIYELKPNSKVKRNMTGYNKYLDFPHVMGIKTFSGSIRLENTIDSVAELFLNWAAALSLPEGNYTFSAELLYYQDKDCLEEPQKISAAKEIHIINDGSTKIEQELLLEDRIRFYAVSDKDSYRVGESIRTWGKIEPLEEKWDQNAPLHMSVTLINCDKRKETNIYYIQTSVFKEYTNPYFIIPIYDEKGFPLYRWLQEEGNYIIRYWLKYPTYQTQEYKTATIDLPITVIPNESEQTFYSNSHYPVLPFEEYNEP